MRIHVRFESFRGLIGTSRPISGVGQLSIRLCTCYRSTASRWQACGTQTFSLACGTPAGRSRKPVLNSVRRRGLSSGIIPRSSCLELWQSHYRRIMRPASRAKAKGSGDLVRSRYECDFDDGGTAGCEVWAHGQDIYDLVRVSRRPASRLRNICDLGVKTYG